MGQDTLKPAAFSFQDSCCPYAFDNGNAQVWKKSLTLNQMYFKLIRSNFN